MEVLPVTFTAVTVTFEKSHHAVEQFTFKLLRAHGLFDGALPDNKTAYAPFFELHSDLTVAGHIAVKFSLPELNP